MREQRERLAASEREATATAALARARFAAVEDQQWWDDSDVAAKAAMWDDVTRTTEDPDVERRAQPRRACADGPPAARPIRSRPRCGRADGRRAARCTRQRAGWHRRRRGAGPGQIPGASSSTRRPPPRRRRRSEVSIALSSCVADWLRAVRRRRRSRRRWPAIRRSRAAPTRSLGRAARRSRPRPITPSGRDAAGGASGVSVATARKFTGAWTNGMTLFSPACPETHGTTTFWPGRRCCLRARLTSRRSHDRLG